ncbi:acyl-CoA N-acyltransferase [Daldinia grandis]|nr:acyl-CoA N-acyltransferase [Daldinia grandis]
MAPLKRKRPHDAEPELPRRATRQHPAPNSDEHLLRSGRVRAGSIKKSDMLSHVEKILEKEGEVKKRVGRPPSKQDGATTTRHAATDNISKENIQPNSSYEREEEERYDDRINEPVKSLEHPPHKEKRATTRQSTTSSSPPQIRLAPPKPPIQQKQKQHQHQHQQQQIMNQINTHTKPPMTSTPKRPTTSDKPLKPPPTPRSDRNIDKVVLGNICFKAWYPSYYGKEVLGDISNNTNPGGKDGRDGGGKMGGRIGGSKRQPPPMLERLYVCPCCFKYSRELVAWWEHVRCCEKTFEMPGRKVYKHPKGLRTGAVKIPSTFSSVTTTAPVTVAVTVAVAEAVGKGKGRKKSDGGVGVPTVEEVVSDDGEWSVWEVDGEKDRLFCQNLSLFAKLFLDNKSVFFDVTGFNYFLLVYTPPPVPNPQPSPSLAPTSTDTIPNSQSSTTTISSAFQYTPTSQTRPQVVGFFSKEKLSWDNNNLACILVFPPWQRKGLGALLMGVSYEISRREGILGGPEKPISELGRKGYKRFWAGEIARWLLELNIPKVQGDDIEGEEETIITVEEVSKATWIVPEDCLAVLREMGVVEDVGPDPTETITANGSTERLGGSVSDGDVEIEEAKTAPRVRLDREAIRRWVSANKIDLTKTCDPDGFVEGYAVREGESEEVDAE